MKTVFLVDPSASFTQYLELIIRRLGYETLVARTAGDCMESVRQRLPDMIMSEMLLPDSDGLELCRTIKGDPGTSKTHFVIVTTRGGNGAGRAALDSGCSDFLAKPVKMREVFSVLEQHIGYRRRKQIRTPFVTPVEVDCGAGTPERLETSNLGEGGMFIKREGPYPVGAMLGLRFSLGKRSTAFRVRGEVVYAFSTGGEGVFPGMGIRFVDLAPEQQARISSYIEQYVSGSPV